jgi:amino acid adenylation domain-containing protein
MKRMIRCKRITYKTVYKMNTTLPPEQQAIRDKCFHLSGTFTEFGEEDVEQSIPARFEKILAKYPDRVAVKTRECTLTYAELNRAANRVTHAILDQPNVGEGPIALLFENGATFVVASLGVLRAGKIQVPLESTFPRARLKYVLEQSQTTALVTNSSHIRLARELTALPIINIDETAVGTSSVKSNLRLPADAAVGVTYTSGSTGRPKGIIWTHRGVLYSVMHHTNTTRICPDDRLVMFRANLRAYLYALLNGATFYPIDLHQEGPASLADWLSQEEVTVYRAAVSVFRSFVTTLNAAEKFPHLRLIVLFGEPTYHTEVELYQKYFSDSCVLASSLGCNEFGDYAYYFVDKDMALPSGVVPGGYPIRGTQILLLDERGNTVGVDQIGEIALRSRYGAVGYWRSANLTQAAFLPDPLHSDKLIYRTGDLGRVGSDGCVFHLGRKDFQIKIRGHRVYLTEVETALLELTGVKEAVVIGSEISPGNTRLVAYIKPAESQPVAAAELRRLLADKLPDYMVPATFVILDSLPLTATGKVDRRALPAPDGTRPVLDTPFVAPQTPVEKLLSEIWAELLSLDRVGVRDRFLELGGDSLTATRILARVLSQFQIRLPLRALLEAPTVAEMAGVIVQCQAAKMERQELDRILAGLEGLSEEEARASVNKYPT